MLLDFGTNSLDLIVMSISPSCGIIFHKVSDAGEGVREESRKGSGR
jgi:uncharacterized protein YbbK (DUF523 family)